MQARPDAHAGTPTEEPERTGRRPTAKVVVTGAWSQTPAGQATGERTSRAAARTQRREGATQRGGRERDTPNPKHYQQAGQRTSHFSETRNERAPGDRATRDKKRQGNKKGTRERDVTI